VSKDLLPEVVRDFAAAVEHHQAGRLDEAVVRYKRVLLCQPDFAGTYNNLAVALATLGRTDDAIAQFGRALVLNPDYAEVHNNLGLLFITLGRAKDAIAHFQRALVLQPDYAEGHNGLGNALKYEGQLDAARTHYDRAIAIRPTYAQAHFNRAELKTFRQGDPDLAVLEALANGGRLPVDQMPFVHFALAKALEDIRDYSRAFEHLRKGNHLKRRQIHYDEAAVLKLFQRISGVFDTSLFKRFQGQGDPSSVPVFVVGMPRSGSSLVEQILASHPQIQGAGELQALLKAAYSVLNECDPPLRYPEGVPDLDGPMLRRIGQHYVKLLPAPEKGKIRIVDKLPGNFLHIGLIRLILPNARIIHTTRNPIDTCVSCYSKLFAGLDFSYDLAELGRYYRCYSELMAHWQSVLPPDSILNVAYENVVDDLEGQAKRFIRYCGLPWDDRCLDFHRTGRVVQTLSAVQVRTPLFRSSLDRWRKYEANLLGPLLQELGDLAHGKRHSRPG
jgi:tetratricopeptide (TPR) repeat protein